MDSVSTGPIMCAPEARLLDRVYSFVSSLDVANSARLELVMHMKLAKKLSKSQVLTLSRSELKIFLWLKAVVINYLA